jgi:cellulose synthase/poly-beta-1,6-N-acetylglucosamine synthase-like glycosyltransferase
VTDVDRGAGRETNGVAVLLGWLLWLSVTTVVVATVGYPMLLVVVRPLVRRPRRLDDVERTVSLIIAAHNEEAVIDRKLKNALALDYPRDRLEIIVASDGSTDRTDEIARSFSDRGIRLRRFPRSGKTSVQNQVVRTATGEILVFSDANAMYRPDAIRKLVRNFADPTVACVCGQLVYQVTREGAGDCERSYWDYEKFIKRRESDLSSLIGANGSIYAVRGAEYVEIADDLISDLVEPLALVERGWRVVYEPEATSVEEASTTYTVEFRRKVRILTRSIKGLLQMRALLNPFRHGIFSLQLIMHKLLRFLMPLFLMTGFLSLAALAALGRWRALLALLVVVFTAAILVGRSSRRVAHSNPVVRVCRLFYYYLMVNYALSLAWLNVIRGTSMVLWAPERSGP